MLAETYASAALICVASLVLGRAVVLLARRESSRLEPVIGLATVLVISSAAVRLPGDAYTALVVVAVAVIAALVVIRGNPFSGLDPKVVLPLIAIVLVAASLPFIASDRIGILGVGINNDLAAHLLWVDWLQDTSLQSPIGLVDDRPGYPLGPHGLAAALSLLFGGDAAVPALLGLILAVPVLTSLTALGVLGDLPPARRLLGAALSGLAYLAASSLALGGFKEVVLGLLLLGGVLAMRDLGRRPEWRGAAVIGLISAGIIATYGLPGLYWLAFAMILWAIVETAVRWRERGRAAAGAALRRGGALFGVAVAATVVFAAAELPRAIEFVTSEELSDVNGADAKLRVAVSPLEALGVWPSGDFLEGLGGVGAWPLFAALGLVALGYGLWRAARERELALLAGLGAVGLVYLGTLNKGGLYIQSKALVVAAPLVMLVIVRGLLEPAPEGARARGPSMVRAGLAAAFVAIAAYSSFLALRDAVVAPSEHADELGRLRKVIGDEAVISLTSDRFTDFYLRNTRVRSPARNAEAKIAARGGKDFRLPVDFDSVEPAGFDYFRYALTTGAAYQSQPPPNMRAVAQTDSYVLYERRGNTPDLSRGFGEEARPGKVLNCKDPGLNIQLKRKVVTGAVIWTPRPIPGKRQSWEPSLDLAPGSEATQTLELPRGRWNISLQYLSPLVPITVEGPGLRSELPAGLEGAIPFRPGQGPFWPVGVLDSPGGKVEITVRSGDLNPLQKLLGVDAEASIGNVAASGRGSAHLIDKLGACGTYTDHYSVLPRKQKEKVLERARHQLAVQRHRARAGA
ncbi:MAG: hypothetical protein EXQ70_11780 [Solirubrobacterales bacterium]|nr:hypothetical protein [Solirubrobacterales bacterium]